MTGMVLLFFDRSCYRCFRTNRIEVMKIMWVIFLLSAMGFAVAMLIVAYIANKVWLQMKKDEAKTNREIEKDKEEKKD